MKNTGRYAFEDDGRLWTLFNGGSRRPSSVEEMEGYCRERDPAFGPAPGLNQSELIPMAMAV
jgi:hypothetical protein